MTPALAVVEATDLSRVFDTQAGPVHALRNATLTLREGDMASIMGPSGSGKSTLLHLLGLMDRPSTGEFYLAGEATTQLSKRERDAARSISIGFVFQSFHLISHRRVIDNVTLPLMYQGERRTARRSAGEEAVYRVGLSHRISAQPGTLSGGEKQRVAIARAIVHNPKVILCDEPTGSLDSENASVIMSILREISQDGPAVLIVTHDPVVAAFTDSRYDMVDGSLRCGGDLDEAHGREGV